MTEPSCPKGYATAYDALFSKRGRELNSADGAECKRCERCGKWHLYANSELKQADQHARGSMPAQGKRLK